MSARPLALPMLLAALLITAPLSAQTPSAAGDRKPVPARVRGPVTLNFVNAEIEAVTRAISAMIERQIVVDPRVRGTITLTSEQPQTVRDAYQSYLSALRGLGFAVVEGGGLIKVVPEADAKLQTGTVSVGEVNVRGDQIITQVFTLRHENANNMVAVLRPLISANNTINASPGTNTLVITDYADNLTRLGKIIAALDTAPGTDVEVIPLKHAVASDLAPLVQRLSDGAGQVVVPGAVAGGGVTVVAEPRSNALIVRAPNAVRMAVVKSTIDKLDRPSSGVGPGGGMWVVHLKNAEAVRLATVLRAAFSAAGTGAGGASAGTAAPTPFAPQTPIAPTGAATGASAQTTAPIQGSGQVSTGGFIQADPATNSLIITGPEPLYRQVRGMIDQLDTRRAQVYIETLIVEVEGNNAADFGFQWQGLIGKEGDKNIGVIGTNLATGNVPSIIGINTAAVGGQVAVGAGLNIGLVRNFGGAYALAAIAQFLQTQSSTNIMSTPNLVTLDNEEAKIVVGRNVPFITGQFTNTGTGGTTNPFQTIERKDVGITLRIRPQIGEGGTIRMQIFQESSDVLQQATGTSGTGPTTSKRSIESNIVVDDGQIIALGGLIEDRFTDSSSKVPLLGDLPLIGNLFRSEGRTKKRSNLMVFLRPIIMRDAESATKLTLDRYDSIRSHQKDNQPPASIAVPINESPVLPPMREPQPEKKTP